MYANDRNYPIDPKNADSMHSINFEEYEPFARFVGMNSNSPIMLGKAISAQYKTNDSFRNMIQQNIFLKFCKETKIIKLEKTIIQFLLLISFFFFNLKKM